MDFSWSVYFLFSSHITSLSSQVIENISMMRKNPFKIITKIWLLLWKIFPRNQFNHFIRSNNQAFISFFFLINKITKKMNDRFAVENFLPLVLLASCRIDCSIRLESFVEETFASKMRRKLAWIHRMSLSVFISDQVDENFSHFHPMHRSMDHEELLRNHANHHVHKFGSYRVAVEWCLCVCCFFFFSVNVKCPSTCLLYVRLVTASFSLLSLPLCKQKTFEMIETKKPINRSYQNMNDLRRE